eukprot:67533_1
MKSYSTQCKAVMLKSFEKLKNQIISTDNDGIISSVCGHISRDNDRDISRDKDEVTSNVSSNISGANDGIISGAKHPQQIKNQKNGNEKWNGNNCCCFFSCFFFFCVFNL